MKDPNLPELKIWKMTFEYTDRFDRGCRGLTVVIDFSWEEAVEQVRKKFGVNTFDNIAGRVISENTMEQQVLYWEIEDEL